MTETEAYFQMRLKCSVCRKARHGSLGTPLSESIV